MKKSTKLPSLSNHLESILETHITPDKNVKEKHDKKIATLLHLLKQKLGKISRLFDNVEIEMAGSVADRTKIDESDEYDVNVVIKPPIDAKDLVLKFEDSSPTFASIEVSKEAVDKYGNEFGIFVENEGKYILSSKKIQRILSEAVQDSISSESLAYHEYDKFWKIHMNGSKSSSHCTTLDFSTRLYEDIHVFSTDSVWNALHIQSNLVWTLFAASDFLSQKSPIIQVSHTASERSGKMEL